MVITLGDDDGDRDGIVEYVDGDHLGYVEDDHYGNVECGDGDDDHDGDSDHLGYVEDDREEEGGHDVDGQVDRGGVAPLQISLNIIKYHKKLNIKYH